MTQVAPPKRTIAWLAAFGYDRSASSWPGSQTLAADELAGPGRRQLVLLAAPADQSPVLAQSGRCRVLFDGVLHNRAALRARFADRLPPDPSDADLVAHAYHCWGEDAVQHLTGVFALLIEDRGRDLLLCLGDRVGMQPLYYADAGSTLLVSPAIETLLGQAGVASELNRAALADHLAWRPLEPHETFFTHVQRVPPGHVLRVAPDGRQVRRHWDPAPQDRPIAWVPDDEAQDRFDALLEQAVARCLTLGPAGIFLSGGLDCIPVAATAADLCQRQDQAPPWALSLIFGPEIDESAVQRGVATGLGLPHLLLPLVEATGPTGMLGAGLAMARELPAPLLVQWAPAQERLLREAEQRGCKVLMTGEGGDEWVAGGPYQAADLLRSLDLVGLYRLWRTYTRSNPFSNRHELHNVLWRHGAQPLLGEVRRFSIFRRRTGVARLPPWLAPDPALQRQIVGRLEERFERSMAAPRTRSFYARNIRSFLDDPRQWMKLEELFVLGRRRGIRVQHPLWDTDLVELLVRVQPRVRNRGGRTKALVRGALVQRFPHLGFEHRRKSSLFNISASLVSTQAAKAYQALGGTPSLADLGVLDAAQVGPFLDNALASNYPPSLAYVWSILNVEAWARGHHPGAER